jgi:SAM-dependent methyltransferase
MTTDPRPDLRTAYDRKAAERDGMAYQEWKRAERDDFLTRLRQAGGRSLLDLGAGPGHDGLYFQEQGLDVTAVDLSPAMVALCRNKGLRAEVMDIAALTFPADSFDAVYSFNSLLHLPKAELPAVLRGVERVLSPDGLLYVGLYGGYDHEGVWADDTYEPQRFFAFYSNEALQAAVSQVFDVVSFRPLEPPETRENDLHFQSLVLRQRPPA